MNATSARFKGGQLERIPLTDIEQAQNDAALVEGLASLPMRQWQKEMLLSDTEDLPRFMEDHIEVSHGGLAGNSALQERYDAKKAKRGQKPGV